MNSRSKKMLRMVLCHDPDTAVERNQNIDLSQNAMQKKLSYREKYLIRTSNTSHLPMESLDNKMTRYLNRLEPVPKSADIYDFVDDDERIDKTYTPLQPVDLTFQNESKMNSENNIDQNEKNRIISHDILDENDLIYNNDFAPYQIIEPITSENNENVTSEFNIENKINTNKDGNFGNKSIQILSCHIIGPNRSQNDGNATNEIISEKELEDKGFDNKSFQSTDYTSEENSIPSDHCSVFCPNESDNGSSSTKSNESIISEESRLDETTKFYTETETDDKKLRSLPKNTNCKNDEVSQIDNQVDVSRRKHKIWDRKNLCPFCFNEHTHFARHIERKHADEPKVRKILSLPVGSIERKELWDCLRKEGNFTLFKEEKKVIAVRRPTENERKKNAKSFDDFAVCSSCSGVYKKKTLSRHAARCPGRITEDQQRGRHYALTQSQTFLAAARCQNDFLLKSRLKTLVLDIMKADKISEVAKNDLLICLFGETHLKKHKRPQIATVTSNKMRELARLLIALKDITGLKNDGNKTDAIKVKNLIDIMKPEFFDNLVTATKVIAGYNPNTNTFEASSLALHMGTSLKQLCNIIHRHIMKKSKLFNFKNPDLEIKNVKNLQKLIEDHWATEISSLALKDITEKHWEKPQIIPVTNDIVKFNNYVRKEVETSSDLLAQIIENDKNGFNKQTLIFNYKRLAKSIMALVLVLNRKRIGEIQYLKTSAYLKDFSDPNNQEELLESLSTSEKLLCKSFKRVVSGGKGSRPIPILFSPFMQQKIDFLLKVRRMIEEIPESNEYLFANPNSSKGWFHGVSVIRSFASACGADNYTSLTSTKFRKQTATILQIMNINENDMEQLANFMGHTKKTHEQWYRLPQDVYQTAKIAKLLTMIDQGKAYLYKGKGLEDITIDDTDVLEIEETNLAVPRKDLEEHVTTIKSFKSKIINEELNKKNSLRKHINSSSEKETENLENTDNRRKRLKQDPNSDSDEHQNVEESGVLNNKIKSNTTGGRKRWRKEEKDIMLKHFKNFIKNKKPPKKHEVEEFKLKQKEAFGNIEWVRIKTFVYNQYRDN